MKQGHLPVLGMVPGIIVEDHQLAVFAARSVSVGHRVIPPHRHHPEVPVEIPDKGAVVVGEDHPALCLADELPQPVVVPQAEGHLIALGLVVWRVNIQEGSRVIEPGDEGLVALVLDDYLRQPSGALPDLVQPPADIHRLPAEGGPASGIAVPDHLVEGGGTAHIAHLRLFQNDLP